MVAILYLIQMKTTRVLWEGIWATVPQLLAVVLMPRHIHLSWEEVLAQKEPRMKWMVELSINFVTSSSIMRCWENWPHKNPNISKGSTNLRNKMSS